jgi:hypothetical protein
MAEHAKDKTEKEVRDAMTEIKTGRRVFNTNKYGLVQIRFPKVEESRLADWEYSKVLQQAMLDGIPTNKEMDRLIKDRNLWTKEDDKEIEKIKGDIDKQLLILSKMDSAKRIGDSEEKIEEFRTLLFKKQQEKQVFYNNTAESKAEESKMSFLIFKCSEDADTGKQVWKTYDDFKNEEDQGTVNTIVYQFLTFINGLPADFLSNPSTQQDTEETGEGSVE